MAGPGVGEIVGVAVAVGTDVAEGDGVVVGICVSDGTT